MLLDQKHLFFCAQQKNHEKLTARGCGGSTVQLNIRRMLKTFAYCPKPVLWKSVSKGTQQTNREPPRLHWQCLKGPRWTSNRQSVFWRAFQIKHAIIISLYHYHHHNHSWCYHQRHLRQPDHKDVHCAPSLLFETRTLVNNGINLIGGINRPLASSHHHHHDMIGSRFQ